jgi:Cu(I)/Ag(I) efflux system membrane fusion protein
MPAIPNRRVVVIAALALLAILSSCSKTGEATANGEAPKVWTCSMHPQVRLPKPGKCPICSMPLIPAKVTTAAQTWTCSMHPQVRLPKSGKCPICSMPLIPAKSEAGANGTMAVNLELSDQARAMAAVETVPVQRREFSREIRAVGKVQYNETALATITSRVEGYIERLFVDFTGVQVNPGDHLVEIYSPDLATAATELLLAIQTNPSGPLVTAARLKLERYGLTPKQIDDIAAKRERGDRVTLLSPIQGTVTEKMVVLKSAVKPGDVLYRLANLESVWVYLDVYEYELPWVNYGQDVKVSTEALPGQTFTGRVWFINPVLTEESRTVKVLLNIANEGLRLKPGMFVSAVIQSQLLADGRPAPTGLEGKFSCPMHPSVVKEGPGKCPVCGMDLNQIPGTPHAVKKEDRQVLTVPVSAVLDSGLRKLVYVERGKGDFVPVEITTGARAGEWYPVLSGGLKEGDRVAVRGNFLLDSQFQIAGLPSLLYPDGQMGGGHPQGEAKPPEHKH